MAIWNSGILQFSNRLPSWERLIWGLPHLPYVPLQVWLPPLPHQFLPPNLDKCHPQVQTYRGVCLWEERPELQPLWSPKGQSHCFGSWQRLTLLLLVLRSEDSDIRQISHVNRLKFKVIMQVFGQVRGHTCCISYRAGKSAEAIVMRWQTNNVLLSPFLFSWSYFSSLAWQNIWLRRSSMRMPRWKIIHGKTSVKTGKKGAKYPK